MNKSDYWRTRMHSKWPCVRVMSVPYLWTITASSAPRWECSYVKKNSSREQSGARGWACLRERNRLGDAHVNKHVSKKKKTHPGRIPEKNCCRCRASNRSKFLFQILFWCVPCLPLSSRTRYDSCIDAHSVWLNVAVNFKEILCVRWMYENTNGILKK